jgi:hypothetical protein
VVPATSAADSALSQACGGVERLLASEMRMRTRRSAADTAVADAQAGGTHPGCVVTGRGMLGQASAGGDLGADLRAMLSRAGWSPDPGFDADGPDGSAGASRRAGVLCYWSAVTDGDADEDADTASAPADTDAWRSLPATVTVSCTRPDPSRA